ncbi:hypothetical protein AMIS_57600 [Actinoplanes missouriensis 431]|uniref:Lipoprotein n=1 Tax=Actinoplanes missouriensis (strain ATCC 14538 / DSM 43046 / CBS 188.64 / JCM 3121 / NBRC 102363 / NCIMB 12654 / NRRL B-3342 / UNCC 431) TaxID=512565 RepID=I0HD93_ACTM4|nr:hypothetical protein [Actinoplanes missouriensis]BAL90980.1 hypothetical protein AMIS_57600 [Actinoplanes missouriensis 431]
MTTRRNLLLAGAGLAFLAGCRSRPSASPAPLADVLLVETARGLVRVSAAGEQLLGTAAALSHDGRHLYVSRDDGMAQVDPVTGASLRELDHGGGWMPRTVSADGRMCVLTSPPADRFSPVLLSTPGGPRKYRLPGVIEPDALSTDGTALFVLEWLPATAPDHYRVRLLDLATGAMHPLNTRDKTPVPAGAEEEMRGEGRQAVLSADRTMLFTLYTHQPGHAHTRDLLSGRPGNAHAFVHVLHLTDRWAYCLDLPHPFGEGPAAAHAVAADGRHIVVADLASGKLAYADSQALTVSKVIDIPVAAQLTATPGQAHGAGVKAAVSPGTAGAALALTRERVFIGGSDTVTVLDRAGDAVVAKWQVPSAIRGMGLSADGSRLYVGTADQVICLNTTSGTALSKTPVDGLTTLRHVHQST